MPKFPAIADSNLERFAESESEEHRSVIVELGVPVKAAIRSTELRPRSPAAKGGVTSADGPEAEVSLPSL